MELAAHPNKHSVLYFAAKNAAKRPYVYKRGPQSRTMLRHMQQEQPASSSNEYAKILEELWEANCLPNSIFDNQDHESGVCSCGCTPVPKQNPTCPPDDKRRRKREDKNHLRSRPFAHIQPDKEGY